MAVPHQEAEAAAASESESEDSGMRCDFYLDFIYFLFFEIGKKNSTKRSNLDSRNWNVMLISFPNRFEKLESMVHSFLKNSHRSGLLESFWDAIKILFRGDNNR